MKKIKVYVAQDDYLRRTFSNTTTAFPRHCDYACAVTHYPKPTVWDRLTRLLFGPAQLT